MTQAAERPDDPGQGKRPWKAGVADLMDLSDPQPRYRSLLEAGGVVCPVDGFVIAASRGAAVEVLRSSHRFSSREMVRLGNVRPLIPLSVDPPAHAKYRKILDPLFAPRRMDALEDDIAARVNHFVDRFASAGGCDFTRDFAIPFPSAVFLGLMGLPWEELDTFLRLKDGIIRPGGTTLLEGSRIPPGERRRIQSAAAREIYDYFDSVLDQRSRDPQKDILTQLLAAEIDGTRLSRHEILDICFLFLIAGLDTVTDALTCFFAYLARHPDQRQRIVKEPEVIDRAVEELLRWESPVPGIPRQALVDTQLGGCPVRAGDVVNVSLGAANVDPAQYPDPFEVVLDRDPNPHLAFGGGVHRCLGSHLARRELRVSLREWHRRIPEYRLADGARLSYLPGLRQVVSLPLIW